MFSLLRGKQRASALRTEAVAVMQQAKGVAQRAVEHTSALGALLSAEVKEYAVHQVLRLVMAVVACVLLLGTYFFGCALLVVILSLWTGWIWALGIVALINLVLAVLLLIGVKRMAGKQLAPATIQEIKNDWQCLKLLFKENSKA